MVLSKTYCSKFCDQKYFTTLRLPEMFVSVALIFLIHIIRPSLKILFIMEMKKLINTTGLKTMYNSYGIECQLKCKKRLLYTTLRLAT